MTYRRVFISFRSADCSRWALAILLPLSSLEPGHSLSAQQLSFTTFDVPGAANTFPASINASGAITGAYIDSIRRQQHGFLRDSDGTITTFDPPGYVSATLACCINASGTVAGDYSDTTARHGFLRT